MSAPDRRAMVERSGKDLSMRRRCALVGVARSGLNQMPMAVWRAGIDKIEAAARAVDMPLRLDNANALPTSPQQKQQEAD